MSFESLVKDCQVDLIEVAECILTYDPELDQEVLEAIEVSGEVQVKALIPGDSPKV